MDAQFFEEFQYCVLIQGVEYFFNHPVILPRKFPYRARFPLGVSLVPARTTFMFRMYLTIVPVASDGLISAFGLIACLDNHAGTLRLQRSETLGKFLIVLHQTPATAATPQQRACHLYGSRDRNGEQVSHNPDMEIYSGCVKQGVSHFTIMLAFSCSTAYLCYMLFSLLDYVVENCEAKRFCF